LNQLLHNFTLFPCPTRRGGSFVDMQQTTPKMPEGCLFSSKQCPSIDNYGYANHPTGVNTQPMHWRCLSFLAVPKIASKLHICLSNKMSREPSVILLQCTTLLLQLKCNQKLHFNQNVKTFHCNRLLQNSRTLSIFIKTMPSCHQSLLCKPSSVSQLPNQRAVMSWARGGWTTLVW
jgi:hypothetical protein